MVLVLLSMDTDVHRFGAHNGLLHIFAMAPDKRAQWEIDQISFSFAFSILDPRAFAFLARKRRYCRVQMIVWLVEAWDAYYLS